MPEEVDTNTQIYTVIVEVKSEDESATVETEIVVSKTEVTRE
jgi:hypothetical protein